MTAPPPSTANVGIPPGDDTPIAAIATADGRGAIGIVRLSGGDLQPILRLLLPDGTPEARRASVRTICDSAGEVIDEPLLLHFPAPHSYTGEEMLEIHAHGNPLVLDRLLARLCELGARPAQAGEFTQRAFLNNRMDLAQAEAVADLIAASSDAAVRAAARSLKGAFSEQIAGLVQGVTDLRVQLEGQLDFPAEDLELEDNAELQRRVDELRRQVGALLQGAHRTVALGEGATVALIGRPNSGKSSLLNALAGEQVAIVADAPGTTRDVVRARLTLGGLSAEVADTAGLHESTADAVELQGMTRSRALAEEADIVLLIGEAGDDFASLPESLALGLPGNRVLCVCNKMDLAKDGWHPPQEVVAVCALTGEGLNELQEGIARLAGLDGDGESDFLARRRHLHQLHLAEGNLAEAAAELTGGSIELAAEQMRLTQRALGEITGIVSSEDLLAEIFAGFCIGK